MALTADISPVYYGIMYWTHANQGWAEKFWMVAATADVAETDLALLLTSRLITVPPTVKCVWARVSAAGKPREARPLVRSYPAAGTSSAAAPAAGGTEAILNAPEDAVLVRFSTEGGRFSNYYLRGIPDDEIASRELVDQTAGNLASSAAVVIATWRQSLENYIRLLMTKTRYASLQSKGIGALPDVFRVDTWFRAQIVAVSNRDTGRPFRQPRGRAAVGA